MKPTLQETRPNEAIVNGSFVKAILSHPTLKDLVYRRGSSQFTLFLADFVDDPRYNGGSEYDVDFRQDIEDADVWHLHYSVSTSRKILKVLSSVTGAHFAADLHDLMRLACGCDEDDGMMARFEEGESSDPTENMSPEDKKKWWDAHAEHKDNFKGAGLDDMLDALSVTAGAESAYNKAQNTWRVFRQLVEDAKSKPWKLKGQGKSASELLDVLARFEEGVSVDVEQYLRDHGNPEAAEAWADMNEEYGDLLKKAAGEWVISPDALIDRALRFSLLTLDQAQSHSIREAALSVAEDLRTSMGAGEGFGTSDATHAIKTMMEYAGFTMGWPNGRLGILAQPKRLASKDEAPPAGEGSEVPDGEGNEQKRARSTWASKEEETVELWALASSDGYMFAATDRRSDAMSPSHWRQAGVDDTQLEEDALLLHLAKVPLDLAEKLKDAGTRASSYDDGYEAMRAARPFLQGAGRRLAADEMEDSWGGVIAKEASEGLYGFPKGIQAACEAASKRIGKAALSKAKEIYAKDEKVAEFLQAHAKKAKSLPAKVLLAAMKEIGPKIPDEPEDEEAESSEKEAALSDIRAKRAAMYGLYGFTEKVASLGLNACTSVRHEAGKVASELHKRKADHHERISSFLKEHCKTAKCVNSKLLLASYPDATVRLASGAEWLSWDEK